MISQLNCMADPGFAKGGAGRSECAEREPIKFCPFSYKKWPKVKDLNENLSEGLRQTACFTHAAMHD